MDKQASNEQHDRVAKALDILIRDQEGKYDECLVNRFLSNLKRKVALKVLTDIYADAEFASQNQSRLFLLHERYIHLDDLSTQLYDGLWSRVPQVIIKNDPSETKSMLLLLAEIVTNRNSFDWIIDQTFREPLPLGRINDIVTLARHYLTSCNNYHIEKLACYLMSQLLKQSSRRHTRLSPAHPFFRSLKQTIDEMLEQRCQGIYYVLNEAFDKERTVHSIVDQFGLEETLRHRLEEAIKRKDSSDINNLSKCLALARMEEDQLVEKLEAAGQLGATIIYAINMHRDFLCHTWLTHFIVYPILLTCEGEDAEELVGRLIMSRGEKRFVERYMQPKYVTQCLQYLGRSLSGKERNIDDGFNRQPKRAFILILDVLLEFVRSNFHKSEKEYKNLMEACVTLRTVQERFTRRSETMWLYKLMNTMFDLLEPQDDQMSPNRRSLVLELIRLMSFSLRKLTMFLELNFVKKNNEYRLRICKWAMKINHVDVLQEIGALFKKCDFDLGPDDLESQKIVVDLVWNHMYKLAREQQDQDLLAITAILLPAVDMRTSEEVLSQAGVTRFQHIPTLLADILGDLATDDKTIELLAKGIMGLYPLGLKTQTNRPTRHHCPKLRSVYLSEVCADASDALIEKLACALCVALRRDLNNAFHLDILDSLGSIINDFIRPQVNTLDFLARTGILETLHFVHENPEYYGTVRLAVCHIVKCLNYHRTKPVISIVNLIRQRQDPNDTSIESRIRIEELVKFYCDNRHEKCGSFRQTDVQQSYGHNKLDLDAYVDQVLNQVNTISFDCY